ncbi:hypothetical protein JNM87_01340 [Candidatus Saccharibacteria bacterium]|nr:hypothetical protein [Candidatus Saccharibacteria bacterium]
MENEPKPMPGNDTLPPVLSAAGMLLQVLRQVATQGDRAPLAWELTPEEIADVIRSKRPPMSASDNS